jgi:3-oxoacyl-[acyl-carrier-protein] synthase II
VREVVVTGLGAVTPIGLSVKEFWQSCLQGKSGVSKITKFDTTDFSVKIAAEVADFDPSKYLSPKEVRRKDRFTQFALAAATEAVQDSVLDIEKEDSSRIGVLVGSGIGGMEVWEREYRRLIEGSPSRVSPLFIPMTIINIASSEVAIRLGVKGPNFAVVSACATSGHAIGEAYRIIQRGEADVMISGGTEAAITPLAIAGFANMRALSRRNDEPLKASRPFDKERDGFVVGEGAGILILEEKEHALSRGATVYAEIVGYGANCDAYHITAPDPNGKEATRVMAMAMNEAQINPDEVDYINAHGTSTPLNDKVETLAIKLAFGERAKKVAISSTKSTIGHLLGAACACETIAAILAIRDGVVHPTINLEYPDPECDLDFVPNEAREMDVNVVLSNTFGFGGHNVCLAIRRFK